MSLTIASFNVENLMSRFDFSGYRNQLQQDRALQLYEIANEEQYRLLEQARMIAHTDDTRQLTALAIAQTRADILCLQEVESLSALNAFEYGYLYKMIGKGYRHKYLVDGNDSRGIDVAVLMRETTKTGEQLEFVNMQSHAHLTYESLNIFNPQLAEMGFSPSDRVFKRDCLELNLRVNGKPFTIFVTHFKSMTGYRNGMDGRSASMPVRMAEAQAVRNIINLKFEGKNPADMRWVICGDLNDYYERGLIEGDQWAGYEFNHVVENESAVNILLEDNFSINLAARRPELDRWTLYHTRGPDERHLCQLDYILASPSLAEKNPDTVPDIIRNGQPWRTVFPKGQEVEHFPRTGWDRPKASDHCPIVATFKIL